jgi:hypothetical protein
MLRDDLAAKFKFADATGWARDPDAKPNQLAELAKAVGCPAQ